MKTIYKSDNGNEFETERECVDYEISYYRLKIISANNSYLYYKRITHKKYCSDYEKIIKQTFKDTKTLFGEISNTEARKLYWDLRKKYKRKMIVSIAYLKEIKKEIKKHREMMREYIDIKELV